jgi:hypothetical protein
MDPADRVAVWPMEDGRFGLDATFTGATGYDTAAAYEDRLRGAGVQYSFRQELDSAWTLRLGPLHAYDVASALRLFVRLDLGAASSRPSLPR